MVVVKKLKITNKKMERLPQKFAGPSNLEGLRASHYTTTALKILKLVT